METEVKQKEDNLHGVWFAAGTAALMACLKRAAVVEQWRVWVFLALNLLLLAILFTSTCTSSSSSSSNCDDKESDADVDLKMNARKKRRTQCRQLLPKDKDDGGDRSKLCKSERRRPKDERKVVIEEDETKTSSLSKEELNEKVEAFIAMFRQHLISDAKGNSKLPSQTQTRRRRLS